jgi:hypothetical protein
MTGATPWQYILFLQSLPEISKGNTILKTKNSQAIGGQSYTQFILRMDGHGPDLQSNFVHIHRCHSR